MKWIYQFLAASLLSVSIALGVSWLASGERPFFGGSGEFAVLGRSAPKAVTDDNLVDFLIRLPLRLDISHVEFRQSILSLDLKISGTEDKEMIFRDLYEICRTGFAGTTNIQRVMIRVMDAGAEREPAQLLIALDAQSKSMPSVDRRKENGQRAEIERYLREHFRLTYTTRWSDRFGI